MAAWTPPDPGVHVAPEIDERFITQWIDYGWVNLQAFLLKWWLFDDWCRDHDRD